MLRYESKLEHYPGYIDLPERFTGAMFDTYRTIVDSIGKQRPNIAQHRLQAYALLDFVGGLSDSEKGYGVWGLEISISEIERWFKDPEQEDFKLISWLYKTMNHYITSNVDPFLSRPKSINTKGE